MRSRPYVTSDLNNPKGRWARLSSTSPWMGLKSDTTSPRRDRHETRQTLIPTIAAIVVALSSTFTNELVPTGPILASEPTPLRSSYPRPRQWSAPHEVTRSERARLGPATCPHLGGRRQDDEGGASERSGRSEDRCQHARGRHGCGWSRGQRGPEAGQTRLRRSPVFRSESGGGLMTLPGDPRPRLGRRPGRGFLLPEGTGRRRLGLIQNGFLIETEPGFPSPELANALADQDGLLISSPNWRTEVQAK